MTLEGEVLRRDVYPGEILLPNGDVVSGVRVYVTSHRVLAYKVAADRSIVQHLDLELAEPFSVPADRGTLRGQLECRLADGGTAWVSPGAGCGCGSPLKALGAPVGWRPRA